MGRFLSPDPLGIFVADISKPQTWNMYNYGLNNPLSILTQQVCPVLLWTTERKRMMVMATVVKEQELDLVATRGMIPISLIPAILILSS
jgi:hypothetical protein